MHDSPTSRALTVSPTPQSPATESLEELRQLIVGPEQSQLRQLQERLDSRRVRPVDVAQVLPEAVLLRGRQDHQLTSALLPTVEEMISGMLTAIRDFVHDSFAVHEGEGLETIQVGELTMWIEQGPHAILACIVRGTAPPELKGICEDVLAHIHGEYWQALQAFEGGAVPFQGTRPHLEAYSQSRSEAEEHHGSPFLWGVLAVTLCSFGLLSFSAIRANQRWATYLEKLHAQPGIVVTVAEKRGGKYFITGLRDPLAADPQRFLQEAHLSPRQVVSRWEPYVALDPLFVLVRAKSILEPPHTIHLRLDGNVLEATGAASRQWIRDAQWLARVIPGVMHFRVEQVFDPTLAELLALKEAVEQYTLNFVKDTTQLVPGQEEVLGSLSMAVQKLFKVAQHAGYKVRLQIIGHTDKTGSEGKNRQLSQERAERMLAVLTSDDIAGTRMRAEGVGSRDLLQDETTEADRMLNRRVTLRVMLPEIPGG